MKLEDGKNYERKEVIHVYRKQLNKWIFFFIYYTVLLLLAWLIDIRAFYFFCGWVGFMLLTVAKDWHKDKSLKWYKSVISEFEEIL
ncbi:MAG: hypothetical protein ACW990_00030 [Promethearchaeota archaeon]|jgi:hypothetical protein